MEFRHIVRLAEQNLKGNTPIRLALTKIPGIGDQMANAIIKVMELDPSKKIGEFSDEEVEKLEAFIKNPQGIPSWMLNRRKDPVEGKDLHLVSSDLKIAIKSDIDRMKKAKTYRGMRHAYGLKVRGQRTKSTGRKGRTVGVQRKKNK